MSSKGKPFVWLVALMCASALAVVTTAEAPPPKAASITGATSGGVMQGQSNIEIVTSTRNTEMGTSDSANKPGQ